jgi:U2-associated protein SR140
MPPPPPPPPPPEGGGSLGKKKQQLPWGINGKSLKPGAMKTISDDKLATFVIGRQKKTKFQREKEEREAKKREAENEAAKVYESFVASFDGSSAENNTFIRGEVQDSNYIVLPLRLH